jgi:hypothetical protein
MDGVATQASRRVNQRSADAQYEGRSSTEYDVKAPTAPETVGATGARKPAPDIGLPVRVIRLSQTRPEALDERMAVTHSFATEPHAGVVPQGTTNREPPSTARTPTSRQRRRPIILGQAIAVPATTDWKRIATIGVVLGCFVWILSGFLTRSNDTQRIAQRLEEASREVAKQEAKVEVLRTRVAYLGTDAYVEVAAREKLGLVKPGDHPVIVLPEIDNVAWVPPAPPERPTGPFGPRYGRLDDWVRLFFGGADEGILGGSS